MTQITLKSTIDVVYRDHMGNDERIVEAMLASTKGMDAEEASHDKVAGRIGFLAKNRHGTPFEAAVLQFEAIVKELWPIAYNKWMENGRMAP